VSRPERPPATFAVGKMVEGDQGEPEDRAAVIIREDTALLVIADGVGGRPGGGDAAEMALELVRHAAGRLKDLRDAETWVGVLADIDRHILGDPLAGETTAVVAAVWAGGAAGASVGDSGAWLITPWSSEELTQHQNLKPVLGTGGAVPAPFFTRASTGSVLLATDGLFKYTGAEKICQVVRERAPGEAAAGLVDLVRLRSGMLPDDVGVVVCRIPEPSGAARRSVRDRVFELWGKTKAKLE
jgi:PPM family protein phosphatase